MALKHKRMLAENEALMREWDWAKNAGVSPFDLSHGCNKRVWWRCSKGHQWEATVNNRSDGTGCPKCAKRQVHLGVNDLKTRQPELGRQWNCEKNGILCPEEVAEWSRQKVWWKCEKGHEWEATVAARRNGHGCLYCTGQRPIKGETDFQTVHPQLALEWDFVKNGMRGADSVSFGSTRKVWWIGKDCGHSYLMSPACRRRGNGCPVCAGKQVLLGINDLESIHPLIAAEWDFERNVKKPSEVTAGTPQKVWWKCGKGHSWEAAVSSRSKGHGCPYCAGERPVIGENDFATVRPELAREWNHEKNGELKPEMFMLHSGKKVWWQCRKGHEWQRTIAGRADGSGCPYCSGRYAVRGVNDLVTLRPDIAGEWNWERNGNVNPQEVLVYSNQRYWWKCREGHEWKTAVNNRSYGKGCPYCSGRKLIRGVNDLLTVNLGLALEWDYDKNGLLRPEDIMSTVARKVWWKCKEGHSYRSSVASRKGGSGCPYCCGRIPVQGVNDLLTVNPLLAREWDYDKNSIDIRDVSANSNQRPWWICAHGHSWRADIAARNRGNGCPYCAGKRPLKTKLV